MMDDKIKVSSTDTLILLHMEVLHTHKYYDLDLWSVTSRKDHV